jgi:hypothetical protein
MPSATLGPAQSHARTPGAGSGGGPPPTVKEVAQGPQVATELAFAPRGTVKLSSLVREPIPELNITPGGKDPPLSPELSGPGGPPGSKGGGCAGCSVGASQGDVAAGVGLLAALGAYLGRKGCRSGKYRPG